VAAHTEEHHRPAALGGRARRRVDVEVQAAVSGNGEEHVTGVALAHVTSTHLNDWLTNPAPVRIHHPDSDPPLTSPRSCQA